MPKEYIGDSVYVDYNGWMLTLTTDNGMGASNTIHIEPEVYTALTEYVKRLKTATIEQPTEEKMDEE